MNFQINDRVVSKKTGLPAVGTIHSLMTVEMWLGRQGKTEVPQRWIDLYPDCGDKLIIGVKFDSPQKPVTLAEYCSGDQNGHSKVFLEEAYRYLPNTICAEYPEDDLEFLDQERKESHVSFIKKKG